MVEFIKKSSYHSEKLLNFHQPHMLDSLIDFKIDDEPRDLEFLFLLCKSILENVVKTGMLIHNKKITWIEFYLK